MKLNNKIATLLLVLAFLPSSTIISEAGMINGIGSATCQNYIKQHSLLNEMTVQWAKGYLSAFSYSEGTTYASNLKKLRNKHLEEALISSCTKAPLSMIEKVVFGLYQQLGGRSFVFK